jgi:tight adherence protein B
MTGDLVAAALWAVGGGLLVAYGVWTRRAILRLRARLRPDRGGPAGPREPKPRAGVAHPEALAAVALAVAAAGVVGPVAGLAFGTAGAVGVVALRRLGARRQQERLAAALPDFLSALAAGLRAGGALGPVVALVARDTPEPLGSRIREGLARQSLGVRLDEVFEDLGTALRLPPLRVVAAALRVQRRTGVALAPLLESLVAAMRDRERLEREVRALSAQGRASMVVLVGLPLLLAGLLTGIDPRYLAPLVATPLGRAMLAYAVMSVAVGLWTVRRMVASI